MLTEFMPRKASHGIALNNFVRNVLSCVATIVAEPLMVAIGDGWLFTGLGVICITWGCLTIWAMKTFCHPKYARSMKGYGVNIHDPDPPFVLPKMLYRWTLQAMGMGSLKTVTRAVAAVVGWVVGFLLEAAGMGGADGVVSSRGDGGAHGFNGGGDPAMAGSMMADDYI